MFAYLSLSLSSLVVGMLIGSVGVGGVLLIPVLIYFAGLDVHQAMATALCTFIATGVAGTFAFQRYGSIDWNLTVPICFGALIFGFLGAAANSHVDARTLSAILAVIITFAGFYTLISLQGEQRIVEGAGLGTGRGLLLGIGAVVGFGSGLTGAGGPVLSVPVMMIFGFPALQTIGASQVVQIIASASGTAGNVTYGVIDFSIVGIIGVFEIIGVLIGAKLIHAIDAHKVKYYVAWLCVIVGIAMLLKPL